MNRAFGTILLIGGIGAAWLTISSLYARSTPGVRPWQAVPHAVYDASRVELDIAFHEGRVRRDPGGAIGWSMLANAYLAKARESDSYADALKAEGAARKSLSLRTAGNLGARSRLVNSLLQQHRFVDALAATESALKQGWDREQQMNQLHADILTELGRYDEALGVITAQPKLFEDPSGQAVVARLDVVDGHASGALSRLQGALAKAETNAGASNQALAWFHEKIGEALMALGQFDAAQAELSDTLNLYPRDYKAFANLTRIAALRGDWQGVISQGEMSNAIAPMADIEALVGDAYLAQGDKVSAERQYAKVVALAGKPGGPANGLHEFAGAAGGHGHTLDRQYAMFCADHGRDLDGAYAAALRDLDARRDVYAFDAMAWVCFKRGDLVEAKAAIDRALVRGTEDAELLRHAGEIYAAVGQTKGAEPFLRRSLRLLADLKGPRVAEEQALLSKVEAH